MSAKKNIFKNFLSNGFGLGIQLFNQILLVPIYLTYWGVNKYGDWIMLSAISSFFAMTDVGLNSVSANELCIHYAKKQKEYCDKLLTNNYVIILGAFILSILITIGYLSFRDIALDFNLSTIDSSTGGLIFLMLIVHVFVGMLGGVINGVYRAMSKNHICILIDNIARLSEALILLLGIMTKLDIRLLILLYLLPRMITMLIKHLKIFKEYSYRFSFKNFDFPLLKKLLVPSFSFMAFPLGNAIILQGFSIIVNKYLGSSSLVLFNTTRTMINFIKTCMGMINHSVWPEISNAYGRKDYNLMRKIHRNSVTLSVFGALAVIIMFLFAGKPLYLFWTKSEVGYDAILTYLFLLTMFFNSLWYTSSVVLVATNRHIDYSKLYLITSVLSILIGIVIIKLTNTVSYLPLSLLLIDIVMLVYIFRSSLKITQDTFSNFILNLQEDIKFISRKISYK